MHSEAYRGFESVGQTGVQLGADPSVEEMPADPVRESSGARRPAMESTAAADELGGGERLESTVDEPAAVPGAMAGAAGSLEAETRVVDAALESRAEKPMAPEEQMSLPKASEGMVGHAVQPSSPWWCP